MIELIGSLVLGIILALIGSTFAGALIFAGFVIYMIIKGVKEK